MAQFASFAEVIERWGQATVLAQDIGVKDVTARAWKARGIPAEYWTAIVGAAERRGIAGVTYEALAGLAAAPRYDSESDRSPDTSAEAAE